MYIGTTTSGRKERFIIVEKGDSAQSLLVFSQEEQITNLIISSKESGLDVLSDKSFAPLFKEIKILHLKNISINKNWLYQFVNLKRLEAKGCQYKGKEPLDWLIFTGLEEVFTPYSKLFENLFVHPTLKTVFIENFDKEGFVFPLNTVIESLSIEKSKECTWSSLVNLSSLKALYLVKIPTLIDITWLSKLTQLEDIEISGCKEVSNLITSIAEINTLNTVYLSSMGDIESLKPLEKLQNIKELTIETEGRLIDKKSSVVLNKLTGLEYSIEMKNYIDSNDN
ncbi:hypothetical protein HX052_15640 [Myroides marinus]|uniref:hypothetical protein n=1 Tax=Myroides marinus TaxID=703342 RepID=UPI000741F439|nr:hypothetical protein [Myroides marinus]KUF42614.1 hypothetical protein AS361_12435 [Myroides marinus]MDM1354986.1 hypothetical protein [Myroides marinus]MDM1361731.1 hypothetical protein [Myroides marinus]MDM1368054.1 hypothetical protein [Myroides marinus]MDM1376670.1 hypothetical protein [Myroides marinus]